MLIREVRTRLTEVPDTNKWVNRDEGVGYDEVRGRWRAYNLEQPTLHDSVEEANAAEAALNNASKSGKYAPTNVDKYLGKRGNPLFPSDGN